MPTPITPRYARDEVRAGLDAYRVEALHDLAEPFPSDDVRAMQARADVYEHVRTDLDRLGVSRTIARVVQAYKQVPIVPRRLLGRHPAARGRGEALERVLRAAGIRESQIEQLRRLRPRFVDDPQAAS